MATSKSSKPAASAAARKPSLSSQIQSAERDLLKQIAKVGALKRKAKPEPVEDAEFVGAGGKPVQLSQLFGNREEMIVIHNMGRSCPYCTMWADGFNGQLAHLENRAAFVVVSPDAPDRQAEFAKSRGWGFRMVSDPKGRFSSAVGYGSDGGIHPGMSTLRRSGDGSIERIAHSPFGPGDPYNAAFNMIDLLPGGASAWSPRFKYP